MQKFEIFQKGKHKVDPYKGVTNMFGKPVEITSKGQYRKLLKQHSMVDASPVECLRIKKTDDGGQQVKKQAERLAKVIQEKGAGEWVMRPLRGKG